MSNVERRFLPGQVEIRSAPGGGLKIGGYAAIFDAMSEDLGGFREVVRSSAFREAQASGWAGVICRFNHDTNMILGTADAGTLRLSTDFRGLAYEVDVPRSRADVHELVERGDVRYSSFAFKCPPEGQHWGVTEDGNYPRRELRGVSLIDVAPVLTPGYLDTTVAKRSLESWKGGERRGGPTLSGSAALARFRLRELEDRIARTMAAEQRATLSSSERANLPDSAFAFIESGGTKDSAGRTRPDSLRHFPIHDEAHVRAALSRLGEPGVAFKEQARAKIHAAARRHGIGVADDATGADDGQRSWDTPAQEFAYDSALYSAGPSAAATAALGNFYANTRGHPGHVRLNGKAAASLVPPRPR